MKSREGGKGKQLQGNLACFLREAPAVPGWSLGELGGRAKRGKKDLGAIQQEPGPCRQRGRQRGTLRSITASHDRGRSDPRALTPAGLGILNCHTFYKSFVHVCVLTYFCHVAVF